MTKRALIIALATVVVAGLWFVGLDRPEAKALRNARSAEAAATQTHLRLAAQLAGLQTLRRQLPQEESAFSAAVAAVPRDPAVASLIDEISGAASSSGVTWTNESQTLDTTTSTATSQSTTSGTSATPQGSAASISLNLTVTGSSGQVSRFVSAVARLPRLVVVSAVSISATGSSTTAQLTARSVYDAAAAPAMPVDHAAP